MGMPMTPGIASNSVITVELQVGQKEMVTAPPDAPDRRKVDVSPWRERTCCRGHREATENTLPDRRWHQVQLQAVTSDGSPETVREAWPH
jgi:hypothetical protein